MACRLLGANPLSEPMMIYCHLDLKEHISMKYDFEIQKFSLKKNAFENIVCEMATLLSQPQCVQQLVQSNNKGNVNCLTGTLRGEFTDERWIPLTEGH